MLIAAVGQLAAATAALVDHMSFDGSWKSLAAGGALSISGLTSAVAGLRIEKVGGYLSRTADSLEFRAGGLAERFENPPEKPKEEEAGEAGEAGESDETY